MSNLVVAPSALQLQRAIVTVPRAESAEGIQMAKELAAFFEVPYVERADRGIAQMFRDTKADVLLVADDPVRILTEDMDKPLFFHPSMAAQRIEREQARGERDRLLRVADIQEGDHVVDATLGLAVDAMVFAYAVGTSGKVTGLEANQLVARWLQAVQAFGSRRYLDASRLLQRVDIVAVDHLAWLQSQESNSVDVVYFDPMFRIPAGESASIEPLRSFARIDPLSVAAMEEARRIARRAVVVKERPTSGVFERHELIPDAPRRAFAYGVWRKLQ